MWLLLLHFLLLTIAREGALEYCWQVMEPTTTAQVSEIVQKSESANQAIQPVVTELLVEEISIDGMCGVY